MFLFCCTLIYSSIAIILMGKRELVALLNLPSWCLVMVERLFLAVPWGCLRFVIVVFPDHTHLLFLVGWVDVGFWLFGRWISVLWTLNFGCLDVGFLLGGCWILVLWTLEFGCLDVGFLLGG